MGALPLMLLALASVSTTGGLQIRSDVDCPGAAAVGAGVRRVLGAEPAAPATLSVSRGPSALVVRLVDGGGALVAERSWPAGPCDAATEAIAVVAATWLGDLPPVANDVAAPPAPVVEATPVPVVAATPAPAVPPNRWAGTLLVGAGIATPFASAVSTTGTWPVPSVKLAGQLRGTAPTTAFAELGLVADVPRDRTFGGGASSPGGESDSWDRFTVEPMGGVTIRDDDRTLSVGAGFAAGVLEYTWAANGSSTTYRWFDLAAVVEARAGLTLGPAPRDLGLWIAVRGRARVYGNGGASSGGPSSPVEAALLVGGDISFLP